MDDDRAPNNNPQNSPMMLNFGGKSLFGKSVNPVDLSGNNGNDASSSEVEAVPVDVLDDDNSVEAPLTVDEKEEETVAAPVSLADELAALGDGNILNKSSVTDEKDETSDSAMDITGAESSEENPAEDKEKTPIPEPIREPTPVAVKEATPEAVRESTPVPEKEPTPEPEQVPSPVKEQSPEPEEDGGEEEEPMEVVEEVFEKKVVSLDTSKDENVSETDTTDELNGAHVGTSTAEAPTDVEMAEEASEEPVEVEEPKSKRRSRQQRKSVQEVEEEKESIKKEEESAEEPEEQKTPKRGRGRAVATPASKSREIKTEDQEEKQTSSRRSLRGRATPATATKNTPKEKSPDEEDEVETEEGAESAVSRGRRGGRTPREKVEVAVREEENDEKEEEEKTEKKKTTPVSRGRRGIKTPTVNTEQTPEQEDEQEDEEEEVDKKQTPSSRGKRGAKTPKMKSTADTEIEQEEEEEVKEAPPSRGRRGTKTPTTTKTPARSSRRGAQKEEEKEKENKDDDPSPKTRRSKVEASQPSSSTSTPVAKPAAQKKAATPLVQSAKKKANSDEFDPYDMDTEMEKHPMPLNNIKVEMKSFGSVLYTKTGSSSKYALTEKAAESRIGALPEPSPKTSKQKISLAAITPDRKVTAPASTSRKRSNKKVEAEVDQEEEEEEVEVITPKTTSSRKRKGNPDPTSAKRAAPGKVVPPKLSPEEQWAVDHPENESEPYQVGSRVYAIFNKLYYPAIITSDADGLGRFQVLFTSDGVVKQVPTAGIIPLRAVIAEKTCLLTDSNGVEDAQVISSPNAASSEEWTEAQFEVEKLDENGELSGEIERVQWTDLSLDMADWKAFINKKSNEANKVPTGNVPAAHRAVPKGTPLFRGMVFVLTSANRNATDQLEFKKKKMTEFITHHEGVVCDQFHFIDQHDQLKPFLISDTYYRTHKYLAAMARGIPCVNYKWINECDAQAKLVDYKQWLLPSGVSLIDNETYQQGEGRRELMAGKKVYIHSTFKPQSKSQVTFVDIWMPILTILGAEATNVFPEGPFDLVLTDATTTADVVERAKAANASAITSEYIIHVIIMGQQPPVDGHPRFSPEIVNEDPVAEEE